MQKARVLGNFIQKLAGENNLSITDLSNILECQEYQVKLLLKGRAFVTFDQISALADRFGIPIPKLLEGDTAYYNKTVAHCMNRFEKDENREKILDIIEDYLDVVDAVN